MTNTTLEPRTERELGTKDNPKVVRTRRDLLELKVGDVINVEFAMLHENVPLERVIRITDSELKTIYKGNCSERDNSKVVFKGSYYFSRESGEISVTFRCPVNSKVYLYDEMLKEAGL
ncbi:MAG: hypothetical protein WC796_00800 [Candidatus Pacearchaeota archaeon]|jgi:hypothetical protein